MISLSLNTDPVVLFFKGLANNSRLSILNMLTGGSKSVAELCAELDFEQSRVSHNLSCLEFCGFVTSERKGKNKIYALNKKPIRPLMYLVNNHIQQYGQNLLQCKVLKR